MDGAGASLGAEMQPAAGALAAGAPAAGAPEQSPVAPTS